MIALNPQDEVINRQGPTTQGGNIYNSCVEGGSRLSQVHSYLCYTPYYHNQNIITLDGKQSYFVAGGHIQDYHRD